ncbi:MAG: MFS transporter [Verrucomicrobia bacterium]|nr:MFS transporter [Verrucomicrobiota bacterium]
MKKPSLLIIFLSVFIDLIGFGIVLPLLPLYSKQFGAGGAIIGVIIASFSLMQFLFAPAWGRLSDRIGRRPVILISNAGSTISYALFAVASTLTGPSGLWLLLVSRIFAGICGANLSVANAYIADISSPEKRTQRMGLIGMAFGLGFVFGPALGSFSFHQFGLPGPGWTAASLCAMNFLLGCFVLGESWKPNSEHVQKRPKLAQWMQTLQRPTVGFVIGTYFLATFCFACFESTFSLLVKEQFRFDERHTGYLFTYCGLFGAFLQAGVVGWLNRRFGEQRLIAGSLIAVAVSLAVLPVVSHLTGVLLTLGLFAAGSGINRPPTFGLISLRTPPEEQGATLGVAQSAASLARIFGPIFANTLYALKPSLPYLACAGIALFAGLWAWNYLCRPDPELMNADVQNAG